MKKYLVFVFILMISSCIKTKNIGKSISADKWMNKKEYLGGLTLQPHQSTNPQEFQKQYSANKELWDKAFAYLKNTDLKNLSAGRHVIEPDKVIATVTEDSTKNLEKTAWESHRKWIDIHYIISGEEKIGVAPVFSAKVTRPYNESRDIAYYEAEGQYFVSDPGKFFVFFPSDAHRPNITTSDNQPEKKIVIKIVAAK